MCPNGTNTERRNSRADLNPVRGTQQGVRRPVLILSHDPFNQRSGTVIAVALTSQPQRAGFPFTLGLGAPALPKKSWLKISQVRTISVERIGARIGIATPDELSRVIEGPNEIVAD